MWQLYIQILNQQKFKTALSLLVTRALNVIIKLHKLMFTVRYDIM